MTLHSLVDGTTILDEHFTSAFNIEDPGNLRLCNAGTICQVCHHHSEYHILKLEKFMGEEANYILFSNLSLRTSELQLIWDSTNGCRYLRI